MTQIHEKQFVEALLDRAESKHFSISMAERDRMLSILEQHPAILKRTAPRRMFTTPLRKPDMDGFNGSNA